MKFHQNRITTTYEDQYCFSKYLNRVNQRLESKFSFSISFKSDNLILYHITAKIRNIKAIKYIELPKVTFYSGFILQFDL